MNSFVRIICLVAAVLLLTVPLAFGQTTVTVSPATKVVNLPDAFTLDVRVNNVTNLRGAHMVVVYDHNVLQYDGVANGPFMLGSITFDNLVVNGSTASVTVDQALPGSAGKTGSGILFTIYFTSKAVGGTSIALQGIDLRDNQNPAQEIPASGTGGNVTVDPPLPIQLSSFSATVTGGTNVLLTWKTLSETDNLGFEVQRSLEATGPFVSIEGVFIEGHGTTIEPQEYSYVDATAGGTSCYYRLKQMDRSGAVNYSEAIKADGVSEVEETGALPLKYGLEQNYPNPFNPETAIRFALPSESRVQLAVYTLLGQQVATLVDEVRQAGHHTVKFNAGALGSGLYLYRLTAGDHVFMRKMVLVK